MPHLRRGLEPLVVTVILIAVAVALAIAIAFWAGGLISTSGRLKRLNMKNIYATFDSDKNEWTIYVEGINSGSDIVSIVEVTINGKPYDAFGATINASLPYTVEPGEAFSLTITLPDTAGVSHSQTVEIALTIDNGAVFKGNLILP